MPRLISGPMATLSHEAFRRCVERFGGCDEYFTEMINAPSLLNMGPFEKYYLMNGPCPEKIVWQLTGSRVESLAGAAVVVAGLGGIGVDINMGCSAPQIYKTGAGIAWMTKPLQETRNAVRGVKEALSPFAFLHVPPFIATLAMMEIVYGLALIYTGATPLGGYTTQYTNIATGKFLGISYLIWIAIIVAAITWFIFNMTRHGKYMYAIGGNPQAAEVAGVPVRLTMVLIYMKAAMMYGLAGFMLGAKAGGASVNLGLGYEMEAIAACTIGGVSVTGGRGKVSSAIIGVAVFELLKAALQYLGVDANAQYIFIGLVIFVAISLDIRKYVAKK